MQSFLYIIVIFSFVLYVINYYKPRKSIIDKYGQPLKHFTSTKAWYSLPTRGPRIDMDFYTDFVVIKENVKETVLNKDFKDFKIYDLFYYSIFEIDNLQIGIRRSQKKYIEEFFNN